MRIGISIGLTQPGLADQAWTPLNLLAGATPPVAWWDASVGVTQSGGLASAWTDRIGGAIVTQASGSLKPAASDTSMNGLPGLTFDGIDDVMSLVGVPGTFPTANANGWVCFMSDQQALAAATGTRVGVGYGSAGVNGGRRIDRYVPSGVNRAEVSNSSADTPELTVDFSGINAVIGSFTATTQQPRNNGTDGSSGAATINTATSRIRIAALQDTSPSQFWQGVISDVLVGTGQLSTGDKQRLEAWGLWRYGQQAKLPPGHPYKNAPPQVG